MEKTGEKGGKKGKMQKKLEKKKLAGRVSSLENEAALKSVFALEQQNEF